MEKWRLGRVGLIVLAVALLVRVAYLADSADYPAFLIPIIDARAYDDGARQWLRGAGMSSQFFWQSFFYPFFLACSYAVTGGSILAVKAFQVMVGAATCALTYGLGRRLFSRAVGVAAGLITAFYGPLVFYDGELLPMGWGVFWAVVLLWVAVGIGQQPRPRWYWFLSFGLAGALAVLTRAEFLLFFLAASAWLAWERGRRVRPRAALQTSVLIGLGFGLIVLPVAAANARTTGHFGFLPFGGGINVYIGNHPEPDKPATAVGFAWDRLQRMPEAEGIRDAYGRSGYFYRQTWNYVRHDVWGWCARVFRKAVKFCTSREIPRSTDVYSVRPWSHVETVLTWKLGPFGFPFGVLLPLALIGLVFAWRRIPVPLVLFLVLYPLAVILVFVTGPYRLPVVPALAVLAAAGVAALAGALRAHRWRALAVSVAAAGAIAVAGTVPGPFPLERVDFEAGLYLGLGHHYAACGNYSRALEFYNRELAVHPDSVPAHSELARILLEEGQWAESLRHCERAVQCRPEVAETHLNYARALRAAGRLDAAADELRAAVALEPTWDRPHADLGALCLEQGRYGDAARAYQDAVRLAPWSMTSHFNLGIALAQQHDRPEAIRQFREALRLAPDNTRIHFILGVALEEEGRLAEAAQEYRTVLRAAPNHGEAAERLGRIERTAPR